MERHSQQTVAVAHGETLVGEPGALSLSVRLRHDVALVLLSIAIEQILSLARFLGKSSTDHSVVDFVDLSSLKHSVEPCQSLRSLGKKHRSRRRSIDTMRDPNERSPRLVVLIDEIALDKLRERCIARAVTLYEHPRRLIDDEEMIVLVEDL